MTPSVYMGPLVLMLPDVQRAPAEMLAALFD